MLWKKPNSKELKRILELPKRDADKKALEVVDDMTELLKTEKGRMKLRPYQALALLEIYENHGALLFYAVGTGKTLISYLICSFAEIMDDTQIRGVLLLPTRLTGKTNDDFRSFKNHWQRPANLNIVTYEQISRQPKILDEIRPEIVIADEAHKLSNPQSAVTRRVRRYLQKNGETWFVAMSGTLVKRSFRDWHHLSQWALPSQLQVLPIEYYDLESWCNALDEKPRFRVALGQLKQLGKTRKSILEKLSKRFRKTPGVIMCGKSEALPELEISYTHIEIPEITERANHMREYWATPDGTEFILALDLYRHLREVSQGFCYEWTKQPPKEWLFARRSYSHFVRSVLSNSRTIDTEKQVQENFAKNPEVKNWLEIRDSFKLRSKAVWFTEEFFRKVAVKIGQVANTLFWVSHDTVGKYLEDITMMDYFSKNGMSSYDNYIEDENGGSAIVSVHSISEGFNLQAWNNNIILCPPKLGRKWEQLLGRTHRSGQKNKVTVQVFGTLPENKEDFEQAIADAKYIQQKTGNPQKLANCEVKWNL